MLSSFRQSWTKFVRPCSSVSNHLSMLGVTPQGQINRNLSYPEIAELEANNDAVLTSTGAFAIDTGKFTGRSPKDRYITEQPGITDDIDWGSINQPMKPETFEKLYQKVQDHYSQANDIYVFDGFCGANPKTQKKVRFVSEIPWQHHFVTNMFIRPTPNQLQNFQPDFTVINACRITNDDYQNDGLNSDVFVTYNLEQNLAIIGGTWYGGEMKKGIFSMMNYWLPKSGIMSMHCSANVGPQGDSALFFGLSGTGKTTLSADPHRKLIGDDEHGWDNDGIFNFEGGCYAKTIDLKRENEPEIWDAIRRDALLENVVVGEDGVIDYSDTSKTQNGRVSYPIYHIDNYEPSSMAGHPKNIIFLTCDAYGVLPPVSILSEKQAMYHFLSGYTAKVAGTERGVDEPEATFSACFGAAFLPLHPTRYAELLEEKLLEHDTKTYLVNTGWTGGPHGVGKRMSIKDTRACIDAILNGELESVETKHHEIFNVDMPVNVSGVDSKVLDPRQTWENPEDYDQMAHKLAEMFKDNFVQYQGEGTDYSSYGPK